MFDYAGDITPSHFIITHCTSCNVGIYYRLLKANTANHKLKRDCGLPIGLGLYVWYYYPTGHHRM